MSNYFEDWVENKGRSINACTSNRSLILLLKGCWLDAGGAFRPAPTASTPAPQTKKKSKASAGDSNE
jgi:hypothetical protein